MVWSHYDRGDDSQAQQNIINSIYCYCYCHQSRCFCIDFWLSFGSISLHNSCCFHVKTHHYHQWLISHDSQFLISFTITAAIFRYSRIMPCRVFLLIKAHKMRKYAVVLFLWWLHEFNVLLQAFSLISPRRHTAITSQRRWKQWQSFSHYISTYFSFAFNEFNWNIFAIQV